MAKAVLTGYTSGIGKTIHDHLVAKDYDVVGFNRSTGLDIDEVIAAAVGCDIFINNAYADGIQIDLLNSLYASVKKMIVIGSVASDRPDPKMPMYSKHKKQLEERFLDIANSVIPNRADMLLLKLSSNAYHDSVLINRSIDFWLENPRVSVITFEDVGEPNR